MAQIGEITPCTAASSMRSKDPEMRSSRCKTGKPAASGAAGTFFRYRPAFTSLGAV
jgi:hypothetical protein